MGVLFWAGRKAFSLGKEDIFQQQLQDSITQPFVGRALSGAKSPGAAPPRWLPAPSLRCPSINHSSPPFSQIPFPTSPKLRVFGQLLSLCSGTDDCCRLSLLKPYKASRCVQQFKVFKSTFELDKLRLFFPSKKGTLHKTPASILCNSVAWGEKQILEKQAVKQKPRQKA